MTRIHRHKRVRAKISGTAERPRIAVFRSNRHIHAQIIDDTARKTLASVREKKGIEHAMKAGERLAMTAKKLSISKAVFDRGGHRYHGRVKALADGLRKGGLSI